MNRIHRADRRKDSREVRKTARGAAAARRDNPRDKRTHTRCCLGGRASDRQGEKEKGTKSERGESHEETGFSPPVARTARIRSGPPCRCGVQSRPTNGRAKRWGTRRRLRFVRPPVLPPRPTGSARRASRGSPVPPFRPRCTTSREVPEGIARRYCQCTRRTRVRRSQTRAHSLARAQTRRGSADLLPAREDIAEGRDVATLRQQDDSSRWSTGATVTLRFGRRRNSSRTPRHAARKLRNAEGACD